LQGDFLITLNGRVGVSVRLLRVAKILVRVALAAACLSAVSPLNGLSQTSLVVLGIAVLSALALLVGWQLRRVALLSVLFFVAYALVAFASLGLAAPLGYFGLAAASAAFLLFAVEPSKSYETT
jgi:hypothetical protein